MISKTNVLVRSEIEPMLFFHTQQVPSLTPSKYLLSQEVQVSADPRMIRNGPDEM
jgi:hypothetical protein